MLFVGIFIFSLETLTSMIYDWKIKLLDKKIFPQKELNFFNAIFFLYAFINLLSGTTLLSAYPAISLIVNGISYLVIIKIIYLFKKSPLGIRKLTYIFYILIIGYCSVCLLRSDLILTSPLSEFFSSILFFVMLSTWPNKPFSFKNIFNELSGDNTLERKQLAKKPKASTQYKL